VDISDGKGNIFNDGTVIDGNNLATATEWEPGKTEIAFLKVENKGRLSVKYDISLNITNDDTTNAAGATDVKLTDVLQYAIIDGLTAEQYATAYPQATDASWNAILQTTDVQKGNVAAGITTAAPGGKLWPQKDFANEEDKYSDYFMLAVHMNENATSVYEDLSTTIDVAINATQLPYEEDSFGSEYDADTSAPPVAYELIANGDFEALVNGNVSGWRATGYKGSCAYSYVQDGQTQNVYLKLADTSEQNETTSLKMKQRCELSKTFLTEPDRKFKFSVDLNKVTEGAYAQYEIVFMDAQGNYVDSDTTIKVSMNPGEATDDWKSISSDEFTIPEGTKYIDIFLIMVNYEGACEIYWDNASIVTYATEAEISQ